MDAFKLSTGYYPSGKDIKLMYEAPKCHSGHLAYLNNKPKFIHWKVVAGERELNFYEAYDVIFDDKDLKIRKLI